MDQLNVRLEPFDTAVPVASFPSTVHDQLLHPVPLEVKVSGELMQMVLCGEDKEMVPLPISDEEEVEFVASFFSCATALVAPQSAKPESTQVDISLLK